jgi:hypothetical protein
MAGIKVSSSLKHPDHFLGPSNFLLHGYQGGLSLEVKQLRHETDHSPPFSAFMVWTGTTPLSYIHSQILSPSSEPTLMK